jgi:hypothetical protein
MQVEGMMEAGLITPGLGLTKAEVKRMVGEAMRTGEVIPGQRRQPQYGGQGDANRGGQKTFQQNQLALQASRGVKPTREAEYYGDGAVIYNHQGLLHLGDVCGKCASLPKDPHTGKRTWPGHKPAECPN